MVLLILAPKWRPLFWCQNGDLKWLIRVAGSSLKRVDPSCQILKPKWPNILHDTRMFVHYKLFMGHFQIVLCLALPSHVKLCKNVDSGLQLPESLCHWGKISQAVYPFVTQYQTISHSVVKLLAIHANVRLYKNVQHCLLYPES